MTDTYTRTKMFEVKDYMKKSKYLLQKTKSLMSIVSSYPEEEYTEFYKEKDLMLMLDDLEKMTQCVRCALEDMEYDEEENKFYVEKVSDSNAYKDIPVSINFENNILTVTVPFTFKRPWNEAHLLAQYVAIELKKWYEVEENKNKFLQIIEPMTCVMTRKHYMFNRITLRDNDNVEAARIINEMVMFLNTTDNVNVIDTFISRFEYCQEGESCIEVKMYSTI